jgi:hypothetical protein
MNIRPIFFVFNLFDNNFCINYFYKTKVFWKSHPVLTPVKGRIANFKDNVIYGIEAAKSLHAS